MVSTAIIATVTFALVPLPAEPGYLDSGDSLSFRPNGALRQNSRFNK